MENGKGGKKETSEVEEQVKGQGDTVADNRCPSLN